MNEKIDASFKGNEFYEQKVGELSKVLDGMETSDAFSILTAFTTNTIGNVIRNDDLDEARQVFDLMKSTGLDLLVKNGWE